MASDFTYSPDFKYQVKPNYPVLRSKFENGYEVRRLKSAAKLRKWELSFSNRDSTEMTAVKALFDAKHGSFASFTMDIDSETITGVFAEGSFWYAPVSANAWSYGFTFEEVLA